MEPPWDCVFSGCEDSDDAKRYKDAERGGTDSSRLCTAAADFVHHFLHYDATVSAINPVVLSLWLSQMITDGKTWGNAPVQSTI